MLDKYTETLEDENIIAWIFQNQIKTERGVPISFDRHSFMIDPYLDWRPLQGVRKAAQCGWSIMTNLKLFYAAKHGIQKYGVSAANVIYTLPSDSDVNTFVPSKTNLLIQNNPVIKNYLKDDSLNYRDVDSIQRKKIENSMVYFKGTRSKTAALMISSDLNIHDESDRSEQSIIEQYESRLENSMYRGRWIFSNPSFPNMPADLMFKQSDQKHWFVKCEHCGHWQYGDWFKLSSYEFKKSNHMFIDDKNKLYICGNCARPISDENRGRGQWVAKYPSRDASGYWVNQIMYSWKSAKDLLFVEANKDKAYFYNFVMGLPYIGTDVTIDGNTIIQNMVLDKPEWQRGRVAMGIDNGDVKHYVIMNEKGIIQIGKTEKWDVIEMLIRKYEPYFIVDLNPYPRVPRELARKYRHGFASFYKTGVKSLKLVEWGTGEKQHMVYPDRNKVMDDLVGYIADGKLLFYGSKAYYEEYISHWETMYRIDRVGDRRADEVGPTTKVVQGIWESSTGEDHYCHATLYAYVALSKMLGGSGKVLTGGKDNMKKVIETDQSQVIKTSPIIVSGKMKPTFSHVPDLSSFFKKKSGSGSTSGNM